MGPVMEFPKDSLQLKELFKEWNPHACKVCPYLGKGPTRWPHCLNPLSNWLCLIIFAVSILPNTFLVDCVMDQVWWRWNQIIVLSLAHTFLLFRIRTISLLNPSGVNDQKTSCHFVILNSTLVVTVSVKDGAQDVEKKGDVPAPQAWNRKSFRLGFWCSLLTVYWRIDIIDQLIRLEPKNFGGRMLLGLAWL